MLTEASFWPRLGLILALLAAPAAIGPAATTGKHLEPPRGHRRTPENSLNHRGAAGKHRKTACTTAGRNTSCTTAGPAASTGQ